MKHRRSAPLLAATIALLTARAAVAQDFNVDFGAFPPGTGLPPATYGAAAAQPGVWNEIVAAQLASPFALVDLAGNATGVQISGSPVQSFSDYAHDHALTTGGDGQLLDDFLVLLSSGGLLVTGLTPGDYLAYTYAVDTDIPVASHISVFGSPDGSMSTTSTVTGQLQLGLNYALHRVHVANGNLAIFANGGLQWAAVNGVQLRKLDNFESVCAGDGSVVACPCANEGAAGHGCGNSFFASGALLGASGTASVSADTVVLHGSSMPNALCIYAQSTLLDPKPLLDGINCMAGAIRRLGSKTNSGNASSHPGIGEPALSVLGMVPASGGTHFYTAYYRNAAAFCTPGTANYTNTIAVTWVP
ncbi:MAG: hypothetical protein ACKVWV_13825 [Planctomycetota bacterium]